MKSAPSSSTSTRRASSAPAKRTRPAGRGSSACRRSWVETAGSRSNLRPQASAGAFPTQRGRPPAADREDRRALGLDAAARLGVVDAGNQLLLACAHLQRERALAGLWQELIRLEAVADLGVQTKAVETAGR